ncbi:MAG TPA: class I SAM-dependent methyltransferase [Geobacteraceae bacterium]
MEDDRGKWNARYKGSGFYLGPEPSAFLADSIALIESLTSGRKALDLACGEGRNSIFLARHGFAVAGLDISEEGIAKARRWAESTGLVVTFGCVDLEGFEFAEKYDLIINFNFLIRDLVPKMVVALNPGGVIVFDTILDAPSLEGDHKKAYLLRSGELRKIFSTFPGRIIHDEELPFGPLPTARLIFQKTGE